ncbi:holo-ACP synthase [Sporosarcina sp. 179-K 3D1 HS]|uniref:holo-ACP synthase n=1 Tax=Sporosarcina sp. 179-K 3D1 HS TaxID=3232169 RepID=UPI00399F1F3E
MIAGIGLDIVELNRIAQMDARSDKFRKRILVAEEMVSYESLASHRRIEFLAGRFAAKEAFAKAMGTGIGAACRFEDIAVLSDTKGKPVLYFRGEPANGLVSITHTQTVAAAQVVLLETP